MKIFTHPLTLIILFILNTAFFSNAYGQDPPSGNQKNIIINESLDSLIQANLDSIHADSIKNTLVQLQNLDTRFMLAPNRKHVALWLKDRFESVGCQVVEIDSFQTQTNINLNNINYDTLTWQYNVIATLEGNLNPEKIIAIGGHYDCMTQVDPMNLAPGADDNGSSVATIIELARIIINSGYPLNKTIRFIALGAEELMHFSTLSGARDYASKCAQKNDDLQLFINNDMIANEPSQSDWIVDFLVHDTSYWTVPLTVGLAQEYTSITPLVMPQGNFGADDLAFWQAGYQTAYFFEHNFSPFYHTEDDVVENCNMDYCAEVARLNMALLLSVNEMPCRLESVQFNSLSDGETLLASWNHSDETDIVHFEVRFGTDPLNFQEIIQTADTTIQFTGLNADSIYYISISQVNSQGNFSYPVVKYARPAVVTLDQGILVVSASQGGLLDPLQEDIDLFYDSLLYNFIHEQYDATTAEEILLQEIGKYSTLIWHIDNPIWSSSILSEYDHILRNYLFLGGNFMFTGYKPAKMFGLIDSPADFKEGTFVYDCLKIESCNNETTRLFSGAIPENPGLPIVNVDSIKMPIFNFHLPWVEVFTPTSEGEVVYRYDTKYDTSSTQGSYYNLPVGIIPKGPEKQTLTLGFPLYYMDYSQSRELIYEVMVNQFKETYLEINEFDRISNQAVHTYPNPGKTWVNFQFHLDDYELPEIRIMDASGRTVDVIRSDRNTKGTIVWDARLYPAGLYFYQVVLNNQIVSGKIILNN